MNKIFKVIWNRTTQSLVVTSELAKGQVKSSSDVSVPTVVGRVSKLFKLSAVALATLGVAGQADAISAPLNNFTYQPNNFLIAGGGGTATDTGSVAIGHQASADHGGVAYGRFSKGTGANSAAYGIATKATGTKSVAVGSDAVASSNFAVAVGASANAKNTDDVALGAGSVTGNRNSLTSITINGNEVGNNGQESGTSVLAVGNSTSARQV